MENGKWPPLNGKCEEGIGHLLGFPFAIFHLPCSISKHMKTDRTRKLPPFFTQVIGSLPRPRVLLDLLARRSEIPADRFANVMDEMVLFAIRLQEQAGIDVITDGEWR